MKRVKIILPALLGLMTIPAMAQETYQDAKLAETALTGPPVMWAWVEPWRL